MAKMAKAIAGALSAAGAAILTAAADGGIVANEWWIVLGSAIVAGAVVYQTPNRIAE